MFADKASIIVAIVLIVIIIEILFYINKYKTSEDRDENQWMLWLAVGITLVLAVIFWMYWHGDRPEYEFGIRSAITEHWHNFTERRAAGKQAVADAKAANPNLSSREVSEAREAGRRAQKATQREDKLAGEAARKAAVAEQRAARRGSASNTSDASHGSGSHNPHPQ